MTDTRVGGDVAVLVGLPTLDERAVGGDEVAVPVEREAAVARVRGLAALVDGEEAVALDREVGGPTGQLGRALREVDAHAGEAHTEADLRGVGTTGGRGRRARAVSCWLKQVLEEHAARLVTGRVDVGDVVADDVHECLVGPQTRDCGEHRAKHVVPSFRCVWVCGGYDCTSVIDV